MGLDEKKEIKPFTLQDVKNRDLIIQMLKYEDTIIHGTVAKDIYENELYKPRKSLTPEFTIHRLVLDKFGFDTTDDSVLNYRKIFANYYTSPDDYDKDVISSVTYMRENKLLYYKQPIINVGDKIPDVNLYQLDGKTITTLYEQIGNNFDHLLVGAFSNS